MKTSLIFRAGCVLGLLFQIASWSKAQPAPAPKEPPVLFRTLALSQLVSGIFYDDAKGRPVQVMASTGSLSAPYVCPPDGRVALYREEPPVPPETKPRRVPLAETQLGKGGPWLLLINTIPASPGGQARLDLLAVDDSWEVHPVRTIRVLNYLKRRARAAVKIGGETVELPTGGSHVFAYPGGADESWVQVAVLEENGWVLRSSGPKATIPHTRSTMVLADTPPTAEDRDPRAVVITNLIETAPKTSGLAKAN